MEAVVGKKQVRAWKALGSVIVPNPNILVNCGKVLRK